MYREHACDSTASAPGVDRDGDGIRRRVAEPRIQRSAAERAPLAVARAADDDDLDLLGREHGDEIVWRRAAIARERLDPELGVLAHEVLRRVLIPVEPRRNPDVVVEPLDELLLARVAELDERPRDDRIEDEDRAEERLLPAEHHRDLLLPRLPEPLRPDVPPDLEDADRALARLEAVLDVVRVPRARLFVLREREAVIGEVVALATHVRDARKRPALEVLREQPVRSADRRVGVVVRAER